MDYIKMLEQPLPILDIKEDNAYVEICNNHTGSFFVKNKGQNKLEGNVLSDNSNLVFDKDLFEGNCEIKYNINIEKFKPDDEFFAKGIIISNGGEHVINFHIKIISSKPKQSFLGYRTNKIENLYAKNPTEKKWLALSTLYCENYVLTSDMVWLKKAHDIAFSLHKNNRFNIYVLFSLIYYSLELNFLDNADMLIKSLEKYKKNNIELYSIYVYLKAVLDNKTGNFRKFKKAIKTLIKFDNKSQSGLICLLLSDLHLISKNYEDAVYFAEESYNMGYNSVYLFIAAKKIIDLGFGVEESDLFASFARWKSKFIKKIVRNDEEIKDPHTLVLRKSHLLSKIDLYNNIKYLAEHKENHKNIATHCYKLVNKGYLDEWILDIVFKYYNGSLSNLCDMSILLKSRGINDLRFDEAILEKAVFTRSFTTKIQKVFYNTYKKDKENKMVKAFAYYSLYEIVINSKKPEYETISILEKLYKQNEDKLTAYALAKVYSKFFIETFNSQEIIDKALKYAEEDKFFLKEFINLKDKNHLISYIEKNEMFFYQGICGNKVYINYKFLENDEYEKKEMKYFCFGCFYVAITVFYGDEITYYFTEEKGKGSIETLPQTFKNERLYLNENSTDIYHAINSAVIYSKMLEYEKCEELIEFIINRTQNVKAKLI